MCIIIFTLRQPTGRLNWYHPSIDYVFFSIIFFGQTEVHYHFPIGYPTNCWIKMEWVSSLYRVWTISICFNHAHVSSRVVPPYTFWYKTTTIISLTTTLYSSTKFPHYFYVNIIYPLNAMSNYGFCRTQGAEICTLT